MTSIYVEKIVVCPRCRTEIHHLIPSDTPKRAYVVPCPTCGYFHVVNLL